MSSSAYDKSPEPTRPAPAHITVRSLTQKVLILIAACFCTVWIVNHGLTGVGFAKCLDFAGSRQQRINTGSQAIDGEFDLFDLLSITSTSGSIRVGVHPQPADDDNPSAARLFISTNSGQVNVDIPAFRAPKRDYQTTIKSHAGSIEGHIIHGRSTSLLTNAASITMQLTLCGTNEVDSELQVSSGAGSQNIEVLGPLSLSRLSQIEHISSKHTSSSGSLDLHYPGEWMGMIEGHSGSGSINLRGEGIEIIRQESFRQETTQKLGHYILARKGNGSNLLNFHTGSGSVDVNFG